MQGVLENFHKKNNSPAILSLRIELLKSYLPFVFVFSICYNPLFIFFVEM